MYNVQYLRLKSVGLDLSKFIRHILAVHNTIKNGQVAIQLFVSFQSSFDGLDESLATCDCIVPAAGEV